MIFDHLGVVVKTVAGGRQGFETALQIRRWSAEFVDAVNGVKVQFGRDASGMCYELIEPLGIDSPVQAALRQRRAILNHVAYRVADLGAAATRLEKSGCFRTADPKPAIAYGGKRIQFFATPLHFIIELIEAPDHKHEFSIASCLHFPEN
jgi:methylmalonyl-CoA/ethylmalonyl-CoA epimerase